MVDKYGRSLERTYLEHDCGLKKKAASYMYCHILLDF